MKYFVLLISALVAFSANAESLSPEDITKQYIRNELNRMPIVRKMRAAVSNEEKAKYKAQLQKVWDFSSNYVDSDRVRRNSSSWQQVQHFAKQFRSWAEAEKMSHDNFLIRAKLAESESDYAVVHLFVEQKRCVIEMHKMKANWKITKEVCPNII